MEKILWLAIGYLFGSFQSGYFLGKAKGIDVRNYGSHSTGCHEFASRHGNRRRCPGLVARCG